MKILSKNKGIIALFATSLSLGIIAILLKQLVWYDAVESYSFIIDSTYFRIKMLAFIAGWGAVAEAFFKVFQKNILAKKISFWISMAVMLGLIVYFIVYSHLQFSPWLYMSTFYGESFYYTIPTLWTLGIINLWCLISYIISFKKRNILMLLWLIALFLTLIPTIIGIGIVVFYTELSNIMEWVGYVVMIAGIIAVCYSIILQLQKKQGLMDLEENVEKRNNSRKRIDIELNEKANEAHKETITKRIKSETLELSLKIIPYCVLFAVLVFVLATCVYTVQPHQQALLFRFGAFQSEVQIGAGIHFKWPIPIETVEIFDVERVESITVGYDEKRNSEDYLWITDHSNEYTLLTGDGNELMAINLRLNYHIKDLKQYYQNYSDPVALLKAQGYSEMFRRTHTSDMSTVLMEDRSEMALAVKESLNAFCEKEELGLEVLNVIIESVHPAVEVAPVYQGVINATISQQIALNDATAYAIAMENQALKEAESLIVDAKARQGESIAQANAKMVVFNSMVKAYNYQPQAFLLKKHLAVHRRMIQTAKLYVFTNETINYMDQYIIRNGDNTTIVKKEMD